jgi:arginase
MGEHLSVLFPQWQGGGIKATYDGAMSLERTYLRGRAYEAVPVEMDDDLAVEHDIKGYAPIMRQLHAFSDLLESERPDTIFTMGGGDDVDILPPAYLNAVLAGDMAVAFFDAHGDLNSPQTSPSKNLHGMPLRAMLGDTDPAIRGLMGSELDPSQIVMVGTRDCDPPEWDYIEGHGMTVVRSQEVNDDPPSVVRALEAKGSRNVYVHIDIDVIDPGDFPYQPVPAADGVRKERFVQALQAIGDRFDVVGICVLGYTGMPDEKDPALTVIVEMGMGL